MDPCHNKVGVGPSLASGRWSREHQDLGMIMADRGREARYSWPILSGRIAGRQSLLRQHTHYHLPHPLINHPSKVPSGNPPDRLIRESANAS